MEERKKRVVSGTSTTKLILSSYMLNNEEIFPQILSLYVSLGATIADVTYGKGVFWNGDY